MTSRKQGTHVRDMADLYAPQLGLLCKLCSIVVHVDEGAGEGGHAYDWAAIRSLLADREVQDWIDGMRVAGLAPITRRPPRKGRINDPIPASDRTCTRVMCPPLLASPNRVTP